MIKSSPPEKSGLRYFFGKLPYFKRILYILVSLFPKFILIKLNNVKLFINSKDIKNLIDALIPSKNHNNMSKVFSFLIKENYNVVDVGGNIGLFAVIASKKITHNQGKVYVFEPDPECFEVIKKNIEFHQLKNVHLSQCALSDEEKTVHFFKDEYYSTLGSFAKNNTDHNTKALKVKTCKLDDYVKKYSIQKVDLIKLNIQGSEGLAIEGAKNIIEKDLPLIITEYWPYGMKNIGYDSKQFIEYFLSLNYEFIQFDKKTLEINYIKSNEIRSIYNFSNRDEVFYFILQNSKSDNYLKEIKSELFSKY